MGNEKADNMNMEGNRGMDYTDITDGRKEVVKVFWRIRRDWREWETDKSRSGEEFEVRTQVPADGHLKVSCFSFDGLGAHFLALFR